MRFTVTLLLLLIAVASASAQEAAPLLPSTHWAHDVLRRLHATGLLPPPFDAASSTRTAATARAQLEFAALRADSSDANAAQRIRGYIALLDGEYGMGRPVAYLRAGVEGRQDYALAGSGFVLEDDWRGAQLVDDQHTFAAAGRIAAHASRHLAGELVVQGNTEGQFVFDNTHAVLTGMGVGLWAGRRATRFGPGTSGVVLSSEVPFTGVGFFLPRPVRVPGLSMLSGPISLETFLSRMQQNGSIENPWFWNARLTIQPIRQFTIGINRAAIFGGDNNGMSLENVLKMFVGIKPGVTRPDGGSAGEFDNQIVSVDGRFIIPNDLLPVEAYLEWGADDSSGAWHRVPGIVAGLRAVLPGGQASFGYETTRFDTRRYDLHRFSSQPPWYRNAFFRDGWTRNGEPLGHPLGGHGREHAVDARVDLLEGRARLGLRPFRRDREEENLYAPGREGVTWGFNLDTRYRLGRGEARLAGTVEAGDGWRQSALDLSLTAYF